MSGVTGLNTVPVWTAATTTPTHLTTPIQTLAPASSQSIDVNYLSQQLQLLQSQMATLQAAGNQAAVPPNCAPGAQGHNTGLPLTSPAVAGPAPVVGNHATIYTPGGQANLAPVPHQQHQVYVAAAHPAFVAAQPGTHGGPAQHGVPGLASLDMLGDYRNYVTTPYIPERTAKLALAGMFVPLDDFLVPSACNVEDIGEMQPVMDPDTGIISYKRKRGVRKISNFYTWLEAYLAYVKMMVRAHGLRAYFDMVDYITFIQDNDRMYCWPAISDFDVKHRQRLSGRSIAMMNIDSVLIASVLNSAVVKHARCTHCKSSDHPPGECPFPPLSTGGSNRQRSRSRGKQQNDICIKFNTSSCTFNGCKRQHKCLKCRGDLPFKECTRSGPCSTNTASA